ncbi:MAG: RNA 2'-phosphotransferase [Planctomycetota bacterium]
MAQPTFSKKTIVATSKFLSLILRHQPETIGVTLDPEGWLDIDTLIRQANKHGRELSKELIQVVVAENDKQRFALSSDGLRLRANQGHSIRSIDLDLQAVAPPEILFHGTIEKFLTSIRSRGLLKQNRNHVHLSADRDTAIKVGSRRGKPVILEVRATEMHRDGHDFYRSENGVWLTDHVPPSYLAEVESPHRLST